MKINCIGCGVYLGEIRDGTLKIGIVYLCSKCNIMRIASDLCKKPKYDPEGIDFFKDLFKGGK